MITQPLMKDGSTGIKTIPANNPAFDSVDKVLKRLEDTGACGSIFFDN